MRIRGWVAIACIALGLQAALVADTIETRPAPAAPIAVETRPGAQASGDRVTPSRGAPTSPLQALPFVLLCGAVLLAGALAAHSMRRWRSADISRYLQLTGSPWGRREDLFVEKLVLELRLHHAAALTKHLALRERFEDLDKVERPLRRMRARFRSVRREYARIAMRIGPVSETVRHECAQAIRRSGLTQASVLSPQEEEALRRLTLEIERKRRALQPAS